MPEEERPDVWCGQAETQVPPKAQARRLRGMEVEHSTLMCNLEAGGEFEDLEAAKLQTLEALQKAVGAADSFPALARAS